MIILLYRYIQLGCPSLHWSYLIRNWTLIKFSSLSTYTSIHVAERGWGKAYTLLTILTLIQDKHLQRALGTMGWSYFLSPFHSISKSSSHYFIHLLQPLMLFPFLLIFNLWCYFFFIKKVQTIIKKKKSSHAPISTTSMSPPFVSIWPNFHSVVLRVKLFLQLCKTIQWWYKSTRTLNSIPFCLPQNKTLIIVPYFYHITKFLFSVDLFQLVYELFPY